MSWKIDARVPVRLGTAGEVVEEDVVLAEGADGFVLGPHAIGCACCTPRNPAALALDRLFQRRARGEIPFFRRVIAVTATVDGEMALWSALRHDPVASARFRMES